MSSVRLEVNIQREARGLGLVRPSASLAWSAGQMVRWLQHQHELRHRARIHVDAAWWWRGEVLERGAHTPIEVVTAWMRSKPHRDILLSSKARAVGVARRGDLWVAHFGRLGP